MAKSTFDSRTQSARTIPFIRIEPSDRSNYARLRELWEYRELIYFLIWRDIKVRYKQTALGAAWAVLQPFFTMVVFSVFFGRLARVPSDGVPYPIFVYTALVPWSFFAHALNASSNSLVNSANLVQKVYFPRLALPLSSTLAGAVDFAIAFALLLVMMLYYGIVPTMNVIWLPFFVLLATVTSLGVGLWLSTVNVKFRDVQHTFAVHHAVLAVCHAHCISEQPALRAMADRLWTKPDGGSRRRLSLGPAGNSDGAARSYDPRLFTSRPGYPDRRPHVFPTNGKDLCRYHLIERESPGKTRGRNSDQSTRRRQALPHPFTARKLRHSS